MLVHCEAWHHGLLAAGAEIDGQVIVIELGAEKTGRSDAHTSCVNLSRA